MTNIFAHRDALEARARENLQELVATLEKKLATLDDLLILDRDRGGYQQQRISSKIRGIDLGLAIAERAISATTAYMEMIELRATVAPEELPGFSIALQDARLIAQLP